MEAMLPGLETLRPLPAVPIPDNPPPHEGAMIDVPLTVEPPDLLIVEVLEALPGRPISGEHLVRPDGTITLGFYGDVHVRGLTLDQVKVKIILHLRRFLNDEVLGLIKFTSSNYLVMVSPDQSDRVFVDIAAYNSKVYFIQGDVSAPGRLPYTGNETVLDVLNNAGGIDPSGDPKVVTLIRPARNGKPAKHYKIDVDAILIKGDPEANLQIFPGDRIFVARNPIVDAKIKLDRAASLFRVVVTSLYDLASMTKQVNQLFQDAKLSPKRRREILDGWIRFWWKVATQPKGEPLDEKSFREEMLRLLKPITEAEPSGKL